MKNGMNCSRRAFLGGGLAVFATAGLPALADNVALFEKRGGFERLSIKYAKIKAGATSPFSVLHISDTHLTAVNPDEPEELRAYLAKRTRTFGGVQEKALATSLKWARQHVDYVVHTGDLIDRRSVANLDLVKKHFGSHEAFFGCLGNHEHQGQDAGGRTLANSYPFDITFASKVLNGVNFVSLDDPTGGVTAEQAAKFEAEVKKGLPIVLMMHVPFYTAEMKEANDKFWRNRGKFRAAPAVADDREFRLQHEDKTTADFIAYLKSRRELKAILTGHTHFSFQEPFSPTAVQHIAGPNFLFAGTEMLIV